MRVLAMLFASAWALCFSAHAAVLKTNWLVLKCKYRDVEEEHKTKEFFEKFFNGSQGVKEYFEQISYGAYKPTFEIAEEWVTFRYSVQEDLDHKLSRRQRIDECILAANADRAKYAGVIALINQAIDAGAADDVILSPPAWNVSFAAHEMLHKIGFSHSFDHSNRKNSEWSLPGEYFDPWDIMSAMAVYGFTNENGIYAGPDFAAPFKIVLGWMNDENWFEIAAERKAKRRVNSLQFSLRPYHTPESDFAEMPYPLSAAIAFGRGPGSKGYTVEYRRKQKWDRGIPDEGVLIHEIEKGRVYVMRNQVWKKGETFVSREGIRIHIDALRPERAEITVIY